MLTVLLVDDDVFILSYCNYILTGMGGLQVLKAVSGHDAIEVAAYTPGILSY
jgi:hypothetical protein